MVKSEKTINPLEKLRVFSISLNGSIVEWCLNKLIPKVFKIINLFRLLIIILLEVCGIVQLQKMENFVF